MLARCGILLGPRQNTVLAALQRLRNQHTREGGMSCVVNSKSTSDQSSGRSVGNERAATRDRSIDDGIACEASKLLDKSSRSQESLTDVLPSSGMYCIEVGKLLSLSAHFGATSSTPRVADALKWVSQYGDSALTTTRQIMSIATPLLNLADGQTTGKEVLWASLMKPLIRSLRIVANDPGSAASFDDRLQARAGILSVFQLIPKLLHMEDTPDSRDKLINQYAACDTAQLQELLNLMDLGTAGLLAITTTGGSATDPVMELGECIAALTALMFLESAARHAGESERKRVEKLYTEWLKYLDISVTCASTQTTGRKSPIVIQLSHLVLQTSCEGKARRMLAHTLVLIPSAISSSSIKDICAITQMVNRLRQKYGPTAVSASSLERVMKALRPKIFLLAEGSQGNLFRHVESSILVANLSRWEECVPLGAEYFLSQDLLELLCGRMTAQLEQVWMSHLIPFLQGLCRVETYRKNRRRPQKECIVISELHLEPYLMECLQRATTLVREGKSTDVEAAGVIKAFTELCVPCDLLFLASQQLLRSCVADHIGESTSVARGTEALTGKSSSPTAYLAVVKAVETFSSRMMAVTDDQKSTMKVTEQLLRDLHSRAPRYLSNATSPGELVSFFSTLVGDPSKRCEEEGERALTTKESVRCFLKQVETQADNCTPPELAALSLGVSQVFPFDTLAAQAMHALMRRMESNGEISVFTLQDLKKIMDATSKMNYTDAAQVVTKSLLNTLTQLSVSTSSTSGVNSVSDLQGFTQFSRSVVRFVSAMPHGSIDAQGLTIKLFEAAHFSITRAAGVVVEHAGVERSQLFTELSLLSFNLSRLYSLVMERGVDSTADTREEDGKIPSDDHLEEDNMESEVLKESMRSTFELLGSISERLLSGGTSRDMNDPRCVIDVEPKILVMLIQSFENAGTSHPSLMYAALHNLRQQKHKLDPLELSLMMNASVGQGVWNARVIRDMASEVERKLSDCPLRQCHSILSALERSRFLSPNTFFFQESSASNCPMVEEAFPRAVTLEMLARAALRRMTTMTLSEGGERKFLRKETFADILASLRALAFFRTPPQPVFNIFYDSTAKRFVGFSVRARQQAEQRALSLAETKTAQMAALQLLQSTFKLHGVRRQRVASISVQRSLLLLEESYRVSTGEPRRSFWAGLSARELGEMVATVQRHGLFFRPKCGHRAHSIRVRGLCKRLMKEYLAKLADLPPFYRSLQEALYPLCVDGIEVPHGEKISSQFFEIVNTFPKDVLQTGAVPALLVHRLVCCASNGTRITEVLLRTVEDILNSCSARELVYSADAVTIVQGASLLLNDHPGVRHLRLREACQLLCSAPLKLGTAVDIFLGLARLKANGQFQTWMKELFTRTVRTISPMCTRQDMEPYRTLPHLYRLLVEDEMLAKRAFVDQDANSFHDPFLRTETLHLLSRAACAVAKAYHDRRHAISLSEECVCRVALCMSSLSSDRAAADDQEGVSH